MKKKEEKTMTKQEENINRITDTRLKDRIWKGLDQEIINLIEAYTKGAGTMPGFIWNKAVELLTKHFEDELAARIKERDERIMEKVTKVTIFRGTEPVREDPDVYIRFNDLEQIMKGEER